MPSFSAHKMIGRVFAAIALAAIAGCASTHDPDDPSSLSRQMFVAGFEDIDQVYIDQPDIGALALASLQQLSTIDSDVSARRTGDKVELLLRNQVAYSTEVDD